VSNVVSVNVTNQSSEFWASNQFVFETNAVNVSTGKLGGALTKMFARTNEASAMGFASLNTAANGLGTWSLTDGSGGGGSSVTLGTGSSAAVVITVSPYSASWLSVGKAVATWAVWLWLFVANYKCFRAAVTQAAVAPQATTSGESILGSNVNFASTLVVAGLIVAALGVLVASWLPTLVTIMGHVVGNPFGDLTGYDMWGWVTAILPLSQAASAIASHLVFRLGVDSAALVCIGVIRFLVGL
jgi:hypothetical protein